MKLEKATKAGRSYGDACGTAHALDLIGERWALLVMRELMLGPKRFSDLKRDLPGISANVLTQRLEGLEAIGVVRRRRLPPPAAAQVYELSDWGYEAEPIIQMMGRWATRSPAHDPGLPLSATSLMLSFRTMQDPARIAGWSGRIGFRIGEETFVATIADGRVRAERGGPEGADAVFVGSAEQIAGMVYGGAPPEAVGLRIEGDRAVAERFARFFPLPEKVGS